MSVKTHKQPEFTLLTTVAPEKAADWNIEALWADWHPANIAKSKKQPIQVTRPDVDWKYKPGVYTYLPDQDAGKGEGAILVVHAPIALSWRFLY